MSPDVCVAFFVPGKPAPGGSKKSFVSKSTGKIVTLDDAANNAGWREKVALFAKVTYGNREALACPLLVWFTFVVQRPKGDYSKRAGAFGELKPTAREWPTVKPDVLKLARSTEDALTGILWRDDNQNVRMLLEKRYAKPGENIGCHIIVTTDLGVSHEALRDRGEVSPDRRLVG